MKATKKKKSGPALVVLVLDESGSMGPYMRDVINGTKAYIESLKNDSPKSSLSIVKFNTIVGKAETLDPVKDILHTPSSVTGYRPGGFTALFDAVKSAIESADAWAKGKKSPRVVITVYTDGQENASRAVLKKDLVELVEDRTKAGWEFIYLGCVADAWGEAQQLGFAQQSTFSYNTIKTADTMQAAGRATARAFVGGQSVAMSYAADPAMAAAGVVGVTDRKKKDK